MPCRLREAGTAFPRTSSSAQFWASRGQGAIGVRLEGRREVDSVSVPPGAAAATDGWRQLP